MPDFGWEYPPGVTGNEPQIAGGPTCPKCGQDAEPGERCPDCGHYMMTPEDIEEERADRELDARLERGDDW